MGSQDGYRAELGRVILRMRKAANLSQLDLSVRSDTDMKYLSNIENGLRRISFEKLCRISEALDHSVELLVREAVDDAARTPSDSER